MSMLVDPLMDNSLLQDLFYAQAGTVSLIKNDNKTLRVVVGVGSFFSLSLCLFIIEAFLLNFNCTKGGDKINNLT